jgi:hypothetical protein
MVFPLIWSAKAAAASSEVVSNPKSKVMKEGEKRICYFPQFMAEDELCVTHQVRVMRT